MTAISLLFSLYLVKPSPFCILDEIDAPLDDANCRRFLKIIETFSNHTQFIIITHNKITMEAAENIYGVTMEQPGISQMVAVRFNASDDGTVGLDTSGTEPITHDVMAATTDSNTSPQVEPELPEPIRQRMEEPLPSTTEPDDLI